ncbi:hypothetical protein BC833DRAFT_562240 [Globomyces pollinis-pini]|nr:hypothetical protein BC833DRAFT_562240 [Globomyces pollinis-pini]KAJ2998639.1 hypothetical protein HDV02_004269 [Globomyces sp. JEL0801]
MDPKVVVSGAGVAGLLLALSLKKMGLNPVVFEQAPEFGEGVGGAIGLYPNGLQIIKDISPDLLKTIRAYGRPYRLRKWMRHDGTVIAVGKESAMVEWKNHQQESELSSMGIRRWLLQKALTDACLNAGIQIFMNTRINAVKHLSNGTVELQLSNNKVYTTDLLFGCDGVKSAIRGSLFGGGKEDIEPKYTGITCLMGAAPIAAQSPIDGICFPSSLTTNAHACYYPANDKEIIFQIFFPMDEKPETWKPLTVEEAKVECDQLRNTLIQDGWHPMFTDPLAHADSVLRVGLRAREPIPVWHSPLNNPSVFLLGDAAHPPVPYIGQGAMMAIEDVGILSLLLQELCKPTAQSTFQKSNLNKVARLYERLHIPRTTEILEASTRLGQMQLQRATSKNVNEILEKELEIKELVAKYGTLPIMFKGARYDYRQEVQRVLRDNSSKL